ncbi:NADH-quinone oxidoreductase subunit J [Streptomyces triticirhizae]|uniref:NADH-quinone oxidoreductase subunit J n=1 Tax=Streptomyces triticirhizae TaxID=2483353 RepID=A0A3M2LGX7_9ACTN|nr:NADH-quinone oxidoreductase subunit J [Streptomyces triticirhizae]RMI36691.1 NADH-quinone oxidoreductase subunit J [Streptomyces triticirhizae]
MSALASLAAETSTSTGEAAQFWLLGPLALLGGLGTVLMRRAVYSALCLAGTMVILALFYLSNGAYFLGMVQIVVYTGAVMMLFLFVLMLVGVSSTDSLKETLKGQQWLAAACGLGLGLLLVSGIGQASTGSFTGLGQANSGGNVQGLASLLFTRYVVAFEVTGVLLTIAAVGATLLTHRERLERAKSQREQAEARVRENKHLPPLPAPGVYARHNAVDLPGLLPDGSPSELTVNPTLRARGQMREVHRDALAAVRALEQRTNRHHGRPENPGIPAGQTNGNGANGNGADGVNGKGLAGSSAADGPAGAADEAATDAEEARK